MDEGGPAAEAGDPGIAPSVSILVERDGAAGRHRLACGRNRRAWQRLRQFENIGWRRAAPRGAGDLAETASLNAAAGAVELVCLSIRRASEIVVLLCRSIRGADGGAAAAPSRTGSGASSACVPGIAAGAICWAG